MSNQYKWVKLHFEKLMSVLSLLRHSRIYAGDGQNSICFSESEKWMTFKEKSREYNYKSFENAKPV